MSGMPYNRFLVVRHDVIRQKYDECCSILTLLYRGVTTWGGLRRRLRSCGADHHPVLISYSRKNFTSHPTAKPAEYICSVRLASFVSPLDRCVDLVTAPQSSIVPHLSSGWGQALSRMESFDPTASFDWNMVRWLQALR